MSVAVLLDKFISASTSIEEERKAAIIEEVATSYITRGEGGSE